MVLQVDASSPAAVTGTTATTTTASFTPPANSRLVAYCQADADTGATDEALTVSGTGTLTWSLAKRANGSPGANVEVWVSSAADTSPGSMTVSVVDNKGAVAKRLFVRVYTDSNGATPAGIGATQSGTASVSYTSTVDLSWGWCCGLGSGTPAAGTGQTIQDTVTSSFDGGDSVWTSRQNSTTTPSGTSVTMSVTNGCIHQVAVEVLPGAASSTVNGTATITGAGTLAATATQQATAALAGAGALTSPAWQSAGVSATGGGALAANAIQQVIAAPTGAGVLSAAGTVTGGTINGAASLAGAGALAASVTQLAPAGPAGAGTVSAAATQTAAASPAGAGSLAALVTQRSVVAPASAGILAAAATQNASAMLAGVGALSAGSAGLASGTAALVGAGVLTAAAAQGGVAALVGVGAVSANTAAVAAGTATLVGVGVMGAVGDPCHTPRPNSGVTARPNVGVTARPNTGTTSPPC